MSNESSFIRGTRNSFPRVIVDTGDEVVVGDEGDEVADTVDMGDEVEVTVDMGDRFRQPRNGCSCKVRVSRVNGAAVIHLPWERLPWPSWC